MRGVSVPLLVLIHGFSMIYASDVEAQEQQQVEQTEIDELIVTARRREEKLLDVPLAITALTSSDLARLDFENTGDLQYVVPNLSMNMGDAANAITYLRGVGQRDSLSFADPGVGVYLDGVYLGRAQGALMDIIDVDRIEILRGPQGTLYGRNTIGGAIKYESAQPDATGFNARIEGRLGNFGNRQTRFVLNSPVGDVNSAFRIVFSHASHDGYTENLFRQAGSTDGDKSQTALRSQLAFSPFSNIDVRLSVDYTENDPDRSTTPSRVTAGPLFTAATQGKRPAEDPFKIEANYNDLEHLTTRGWSMNIDWHPSETVSYSSITSVRQVEHQTHIDLDGTEYGVFGVHVDQEQEQLSQEFQMLFDGTKLNGVLGLFWFSETDVTPDGIRGTEVIPFFFAPYNTVSENDQSIAATALFSEMSFALSDQLEGVFGLRYTTEDKKLNRKACQAFGGAELRIEDCNPPPGSQNPFGLNIELSETFAAWTPKLGLTYDYSEDGMMYVSWSRGFKSGGFDGRIGYNNATSDDAVEAQAQPYDAEIADTFEIGWKSKIPNSDWRISSVVFFNDYNDLQLSSFSATPEGGFATVFTNAGRASSKGLEVELAGEIADGWSLISSLGWLDSQYDEFINAMNIDVSDDLVPIHSPEITSHLSIVRRVETKLGTVEIGLSSSFKSEYYVTISNLPQLKQEGYSRVDGLFSLSDPNERWQVRLTGKNLLNREFITHGFDLTAFPGVALAYHGEPRTWIASLSYRF